MTIETAWGFVQRHESQGDLEAIGDDGRAGGVGQMWWVFRREWWPDWCWKLLAVMDGLAFRRCVMARGKGLTLREFYCTVYNPGAKDVEDLPDAPLELE